MKLTKQLDQEAGLVSFLCTENLTTGSDLPVLSTPIWKERALLLT